MLSPRMKRVFLIALTPLLFVSCSTHRGWMRPAPFAHNKYLVPVPDYKATVVVAAPRGWHLDPEGFPCYAGSFGHPDHFMSPIVISTEGDRRVGCSTSQSKLYSFLMRDARLSEAKRLAMHRKLFAGSNAKFRPKPILHDPVTTKKLLNTSLRDGRQIWIARFHSPVAGYRLEANIPENGFVSNVTLPLEGSSVPDDLLAAMVATVQSYRCEHE